MAAIHMMPKNQCLGYIKSATNIATLAEKLGFDPLVRKAFTAIASPSCPIRQNSIVHLKIMKVIIAKLET